MRIVNIKPKKINHCILFLILFLTFIIKLNAQNIDSNTIINLEIDTLNKVLVNLKDGGNVNGYFVSVSKNELKVNNDLLGIVTIQLKNISRIKKIYYTEVAENRRNEYDSKNPNNLDIITFGGPGKSKYGSQNVDYEPQFYTHKYYMSNNYNGLKKKEIIYQNLWFLYNGVDYGLNDNFSIGGGALMMFVSGFVNIHLRSQMELNEYIKLGLCYNVFFANEFGSNSGIKTFGIFTGGATIGSEFNNITLSMGKGNFSTKNPYAFTNPDLNNYGYSISGIFKLNKYIYAITDNFLMNKYDEKYFSLGLRFLGKNTAFDLGVMGNTYKEKYYSYSNFTGSYWDSKEIVRTIFYPFIAFTKKIN